MSSIEKGVICKGPREVMELTNNRDDPVCTWEESESKEKSAVNDSRYPTEISLSVGSQISTVYNPLKISLFYSKPKLSQLVSYLSCTIKLLKNGALLHPLTTGLFLVYRLIQNVRMTSSYSTASSAGNPSFIRLRKPLNKQAIRFLLEMYHATLQ